MSKYNIAYIYFHNEPYELSPITPSHVLNSDFLDFIKFFPKNLFQIIDGYGFFVSSITSEFCIPYSIYISSQYPIDIIHPHLIGVVFWNRPEDIPSNINGIFPFPVVIKDVRSEKRNVFSILSLVDSILFEISKLIVDSFSKSEPIRKKFIIKKKKNSESKLSFPNFNPSNLNYLILSHINSSFGKGLTLKTVNDVQSRKGILLDSIKKLDSLHSNIIYDFIDSRDKDQSYRPFYPFSTIIVVAPWINAKLLKFKNLRKLSIRLNKTYQEAYIVNKTLNLGQNQQTYLFEFNTDMFSTPPTKDEIDIYHASQSLVNDRITACDNIATLHASFKSSPIYRLPLIGRKIDKDLNWFSPTEVDRRYDDKHHFRMLQTLGASLGNSISDEFFDYLLERNGPVLIISDLPIELASRVNVPLFFTHDISRLPETSYESCLSEFVKHSYFDFSIDENLLSNTLVVCASPNDEVIKAHFELIKIHVQSQPDGEKVRFVSCSLKEELSKIISEIKPQLLIIDTHGFHRKDTLDSGIMIGEEYVTASDIVKLHISAPLVILSACYTAPVFGYIGPIAHGFFEAGAFSVLSTILPIDVSGANILYSRILTNLRYALKENIHDNWSGFISHNLRTSLFDDYMLFITKKLETRAWVSEDAFQDIRVKWQTDSLFHGKRVECFRRIHEAIMAICNETYISKVEAILNSLDGFVPDSYAYTLMGRGDLVKMPLRKKMNIDYIKKLHGNFDL